MWTVLKRAALALIALLVVLAGVGFGYERVMAAGDQPSKDEEGGQPLVGLMQAAQPFGIARLLSDGILASSIYPHLSVELQPAYRAGVNRASFISTIAAEAQQRQTSIDQVRQMGMLGDLPIVVLASSRPVAFNDDPVPPELSGRVSDVMHVMLKGSHQAIAHLSATGHVESVADTGHYIQFDRPDAVIQVIQDMLVAGR